MPLNLSKLYLPASLHTFQAPGGATTATTMKSVANRRVREENSPP
jgi:hypothetical protein